MKLISYTLIFLMMAMTACHNSGSEMTEEERAEWEAELAEEKAEKEAYIAENIEAVKEKLAKIKALEIEANEPAGEKLADMTICNYSNCNTMVVYKSELQGEGSTLHKEMNLSKLMKVVDYCNGQGLECYEEGKIQTGYDSDIEVNIRNILQAKYVIIIDEGSSELPKFAGTVFIPGSYRLACYLVEIESGKVMNKYVLDRTNSDEVSYTPEEFLDTESAKEALNEDLLGGIQEEYRAGLQTFLSGQLKWVPIPELKEN